MSKSQKFTEISIPPSILIVDKDGIIGNKLCEVLAKHLASRKDTWQIVIATARPISAAGKSDHQNIVHVAFTQDLPVLPAIRYDAIVVISPRKQEIGKELLFECAKKANLDGARLIVGLPFLGDDEPLIEDMLQIHPKTSVVLYGDIFGGQREPETSVYKLLVAAKTKGRIAISHMGMQLTYPVFIDDVVVIFFKLIIEEKNLAKTYFAFPKHPITELALARILQKIDPLLQVDFLKEEGTYWDSPPIHRAGEYLLDSSYPLQKRLKEVSDSISQDGFWQHEEVGESIHPSVVSGWLFRGALLFVITVATPILMTFFASLIGFSLLAFAKEEIVKGNFTTAASMASSAASAFSFSNRTSDILFLMARPLGEPPSVVVHLRKGSESGYQLAQMSAYGIASVQYFSSAFSDSTSASSDDFRKGINSLKSSFSLLEKVKLQDDMPRDIVSMLHRIGPSLSLVASTADSLWELLGFEGSRQYLVLFQNNMELRPGGGFIGSYGLLMLEKGRVKDFSIHNVYDADGQLKGHVEPPFAIRRHIPIQHWYLRDSNFSIDFPISASASAFLFKLETGKTVDGVIGVDVSFVRELLRAMGTVSIPEYNETVTVDNMYSLTQTHAEKDFFPGSTQKRDFLRSLFTAMQTRLVQEKSIPYIALLESVGKAIMEKHIIFAFSNPSIANLFIVNGMSSSLATVGEDPADIHDTVGVSEANVGINKTNYFIKRKIDYRVGLEESGRMAAELTISYKNTSSAATQFGGPYKNYLRIIAPKGATLSSIKIDGEEKQFVPAIVDPVIYERKNFKPPAGIEVETNEEAGKTTFGLLIEVPTGALRTVAVSYHLPQFNLLLFPDFAYKLRVFKQPGTEDDPFSFSFTYPDSLRIAKAISIKGDSKLGVEQKGVVSFRDTLFTDKEIHVEFAQK